MYVQETVVNFREILRNDYLLSGQEKFKKRTKFLFKKHNFQKFFLIITFIFLTVRSKQ